MNSLNEMPIRKTSIVLAKLNETKKSRMDQVKFAEDIL